VWTEGKPLRIVHGHTLSVGEVEGRTLALVTKNDAKASARSVLVVSVERDRFTTLGEILEPALSVSVAGGEALVRLPSGWHRIELGSADASQGKGSPAKKAAETPPALTLVFGERSSPPPLPEAVRERIGERIGPLETRVCHGGVFAGIRETSADPPRLITMRDMEVIMDVEAKDVLRFHVTDAGRHAFVIERTDTKRVLEQALGDAAWRSVPIHDVGGFGPDDLAAFDASHLVVKSSTVLELWRRDGDGWHATHRVKVPDAASVRSHPRCIVVAGMKVVRAYVRAGDKLRLACEAPHPRPPRSLLPRIVIGLDGRLWIDDWEASLT
jgi:hypothetical protein